MPCQPTVRARPSVPDPDSTAAAPVCPDPDRVPDPDRALIIQLVRGVWIVPEPDSAAAPPNAPAAGASEPDPDRAAVPWWVTADTALNEAMHVP